ncbi:MAG: site-specific integrase, partial [Oscillospiraceae bacterium]|nr:site-specific integrase [Oscillospiraceae bacterium]
RKEIHPLTDEEIPQFLAAIEDHPYRNVYAVCLFAGLREGEVLGLSWDQVDYTRGRITINQQLQHGKKAGSEYFISDSTKSGKARTIEPPPIAFEYLRSEQVRQLENRLRAGDLWNNPHNLVFTDECGKNLTLFSFYRRFKRIAESIGRPDLRPHDLRHTCATVAIALGADIKSVQSLMGHATASFTMDVYAHTSERMMQDTAGRVQSYYDNLKKMG